jgi:hypothetical protein
MHLRRWKPCPQGMFFSLFINLLEPGLCYFRCSPALASMIQMSEGDADTPSQSIEFGSGG